jgi:hypothetical protein
MLDADVTPGENVLSHLLHTAHTAEFHTSVLGYAGWVMPAPNSESNLFDSYSSNENTNTINTNMRGNDGSTSGGGGLLYPDRANGIFPDMSMEVDCLTGMWFMRTALMRLHIDEVS